MNKQRILLMLLLVMSLVFAGCHAAPPAETTPTVTTIAIEPINKTVFTWEDFSTVRSGKTTFEELCRLIPLTEQLQMTMYTTTGYYTYPTEDGGFVRVHFTVDDTKVSAIFYYPGENSDYYPVKDIDVFSFRNSICSRL